MTMEYSVLIVEDLEQFYIPMLRWTKDIGASCLLAKSLKEGKLALQKHSFKVGIIDIRLKDSDPTNEDGMVLIEWILKNNIDINLAVCTAYEDVNNVLILTQEFNIATYIQKTARYRRKFITYIKNYALVD